MKKKSCLVMAGVFLAAGMMLSSAIKVSAKEENAETISKGVYIGGVDVSGMTAEEAKNAVGQTIDTARDVCLTLTVDDATAEVQAGEMGLAWKNTDVVEEALGLGKSGNIVKRYKDKKDLENNNRSYGIEYGVDRDKIKKVVEDNADVWNRAPSDAEISMDSGSFEVVKGQNGIEVNTEKSAKKIAEFINNEWDMKSSASIELVADIKEPEYTTADLERITDVLGTATTYYGSSYSRNLNVETGAAKLNGHLLMPGEVFSVTEAVTPFTAENGYEPAPSYESGKVVDSYGGGICQVSTTLYNAVLKAELEVVERHNHTMIVTYVDPSKDAAIAEGLMDFRFANNTEDPIYITGYAYGGELTFTIYGHETRNPDRVVEYVSETVSTTPADGVKLYAKADQPVGYLAQTQSAHQGLSAVLWKYVTENGETTKEQVNSSNYQAVPVSYDVGISTSDPNVAAAIQAAIASNSLEQVQAVINGNFGTPEQEESETEPSESQQTDAAQTPEQTEAPQMPEQTEAPQVPEQPEAPQIPEQPDATVVDDVPAEIVE